MGCDIHFHSEIKVNGKWRHYLVKEIERDYPLFAVMADVRNYEGIVPLSKPKGLPDDVSFETDFCYQLEKIDAHSESWLNANEIQLLYNWVNNRSDLPRPSEIFGYVLGQSWGDFFVYPDYFQFLEDIRFVFWFDS